MQTIEEIVAELTRRWGRMTLADLRCAALQEATGSAFEALRDEDGRRIALVLMATEPRSITILESLGSLPS